MRFFIALTFLILGLSPMAQAQPPLKVTYGLYASGFDVVKIDGTYTMADDKYDLTMDLVTDGLLGKVAPWSGVLKTNGIANGDKSSPLEHSFASTWRGDTETKTFTFGKDGALKSITEEEDGKVETLEPKEEVIKGTPLDTLTALFRSMNQDSCAGVHDVSDGKRRFNMVFKSKGMDTIAKSRYTVFNGKAEKCEVEIVPTAGKWRDKPRGWMSIQEQAKGQGMLPTIWFAKVRDDYPPIPVKFLINTNYGTMIMHVQNIQ